MIKPGAPLLWARSGGYLLAAGALAKRGYVVTRPSQPRGLAARLLSAPHPELFRLGVQSKILVALVPKCANSSLARWLTTLEARMMGISPEDVQFTRNARDEYLFDLRILPDSWLRNLGGEAVTSIRVIRHPAERALSAYLDKRRNPGHSSIRRALPPHAWSTFSDFLRALSSRPSYLTADPHWAPQHWLLADAHEGFTPIPITRLDAALQALAAAKGVAPLPTRDGWSGHPTHARESLERHAFPGMEELISELYADDLNEWHEHAASEHGHGP